VVIPEISSPAWKWHVFAIFLLLTALWNLWVFGPDQRFDRVLKPTLDVTFKNKLRECIGKLVANDRLAFRVNIMVPEGYLFWAKLRIVYEYNMEPSDPDFRLAWPKSMGICWQVLRTGKAGWFDRGEHEPTNFGLDSAHLLNTKACGSGPLFADQEA